VTVYDYIELKNYYINIGANRAKLSKCLFNFAFHCVGDINKMQTDIHQNRTL